MSNFQNNMEIYEKFRKITNKKDVSFLKRDILLYYIFPYKGEIYYYKFKKILEVNMSNF